MLKARFDGGCRRNPGGPAACAFFVEKDGIEIHRDSKHLGSSPRMTNNVAEFAAMKMILEWSEELEGEEPLLILGDSQIVINRMKKGFRGFTSGLCAEIAFECVKLGSSSKRVLHFQWTPREQNEITDAMCNLILGDKKDVKIWKQRKLAVDQLPFGGIFSAKVSKQS